MRFSHGHRLRHGRFSEPNRTYLVTTVTYDRQPLFTDLGAGRLLVRELRAAQAQGRADSLAWVIMPDHLHWLFILRDATLQSLMRFVKSRSGREINRIACHRGPVWQPGYHDHALRRDEDLIGIARYVVANPLRARLVRRIGDYPLWDAMWLV
jgi:REP element-mobilizing transposase RayT